MSDAVTLQDALFAAKLLSLEDQQELNRLLVDNIREVQRQESRKVAASLRTGDTVKFQHSKTNVWIFGTIKKFNPTRVIVSSQYDKYGYTGSRFPIEWTVPASMLTKIDALPPEPAPKQRAVTRMVGETMELTSKDVGVLTVGPNGKLGIK